MSLDIGGAETHITELACELRRQGHDVTVASNGGVYVEKLEKNGIRHIAVPLHSKNPLNVSKAYRILYADIAAEKYDIVHAHARIPGFVCGLLNRRLHFRFVTTCHGVYAMNFLWKAIADWGERSLAVSCDIKNYLIRQYGVRSSNIAVTINGINSDEFSSHGADRDSVCDEFGLDSSCRFRVIHVSRIDNESVYTARLLCAAVKELAEKNIRAELMIIGGGTAFGELKTLADEINEALGYRAVTLTGPRTDIARLLSAGDVFAGVSRAALEAMAAEKPVILCGSPDYGQGCAGIFTEDILDESLAANFTARGCEVPDVHDISGLLAVLYALSPGERAEQGKYNRSVVEKYYPVSKMAEDALNVYESLRPFVSGRYSEVIISGYYGYGNAGDDSLLRSIIDRLREEKEDIAITVLSAHPKETAQLYNVRSVARFNIPAVIHELRHAKLLINGSGNLLQNGTSSRSLFYYTGLTKYAKRLGCRTMMYAGGIGPLNGEWAEKVSRETLDMCDAITLREEMSLDIIRSIGADCAESRVNVTADPAILLKPEDERWTDYIMRREGIEGKFFVIALRDWSDTQPDFEKIISRAVSEIKSTYSVNAVFAVMQPGYDDKICDNAASATDSPVLRGLNPSELEGIFSKAEFVIGMRLHALVYSAAVSTPFIGLAYDIKIKAFTSRFAFPNGFDSYIDVKEADCSHILSAVDSLFANRDDIISSISHSVDNQRVLAATDAVRAVGLIGYDK